MSYDPLTNSTLQTGKRVQLNETHFSYAALKEFLSQFARKERKAPPTSRKLTPYLEIFVEKQFNSDILFNEKACVVFFTDSKLPIEKQTTLFNELQKEIKSALQIAVYYLPKEV